MKISHDIGHFVWWQAKNITCKNVLESFQCLGVLFEWLNPRHRRLTARRSVLLNFKDCKAKTEFLRRNQILARDWIIQCQSSRKGFNQFTWFSFSFQFLTAISTLTLRQGQDGCSDDGSKSKPISNFHVMIFLKFPNI